MISTIKKIEDGGFSKDIFVNEIPTELCCGLCSYVLNDPHQCKNGHMFCKPCFTKSLKFTQSCPTCKVIVDVEFL
jgi:hypothetical protein